MTLISKQEENLENILNRHYQEPQSFEEFRRELLELGIIRINYDAISNEMSFFNQDALVWVTERTDIGTSKKSKSWILGKKLDIHSVEKSLHAIDNGQTDPVSFHHELFSAGVVFVVVYLEQRINYYLGIDGETFIERY